MARLAVLRALWGLSGGWLAGVLAVGLAWALLRGKRGPCVGCLAGLGWLCCGF